jgi:hypothetical protein
VDTPKISIIDRIDTTATHGVISVLTTPAPVPVQQVAATFGNMMAGIGVNDLSKTPGRPQFGATRAALLTALDPKTTVTSYTRARLGVLPSWLPKDWFDDGRLQPIMAAPVFTRPMYEALDAYDRDWLIPGLGAIQEANLVSLLETNPAFTEAFLVGLSDEMGRELLWRGYPTDQRGTYFKRFWEAGFDDLAAPIHQFSHQPLGGHIDPKAGGASGRVVLLVRGELIRRYPNAIMMTHRQIAKPDRSLLFNPDGTPVFADPSQPGGSARVIFHVPLTPDIMLTAFELTVPDVLNNPWWFLIAEHPTAPRFGLGLAPGSAPAPPPGTVSRDQANWGSFGPLRFSRFLATNAATVTVKEPPAKDPSGKDIPSSDATIWSAAALHGAAVARVLLRDPYRAAFKGADLILKARPS